jgi:hypothetical protein
MNWHAAFSRVFGLRVFPVVRLGKLHQRAGFFGWLDEN